MDLSVIYHGDSVGTAAMESDGIYWKIVCRMTQSADAPIRLYGIHSWQSEYLGIPDAEGRLTVRIAKKHLPDGAKKILASRQPNGTWKPWAGEIDGVKVENALLRRDNGILLALESDEAVRFPEWIEFMEKVQVSDSERLLLRLDGNGNLPEIENKLGGINNETMDRDAHAVELPSDAPSCDDDDCIGGNNGTEQGWEADSTDF